MTRARITLTTGIVGRASEEKHKKVKNNNVTNRANSTHTHSLRGADRCSRSVAVKAGVDDEDSDGGGGVRGVYTLGRATYCNRPTVFAQRLRTTRESGDRGVFV